MKRHSGFGGFSRFRGIERHRKAGILDPKSVVMVPLIAEEKLTQDSP